MYIQSVTEYDVTDILGTQPRKNMITMGKDVSHYLPLGPEISLSMPFPYDGRNWQCFKQCREIWGVLQKHNCS